MNLDAKSNENDQNSNAAADSRPTFEEAKAIADAAFARLDSSTRSSLAADRRAFEEAESRLVAANAERDKAWSVLPEDVRKSLAEAARKKPTGSTTEFLELKPEATPMEAFVAAVRARRRLVRAREDFRRRRAECRDLAIDRFLSTCAGYSTLDASFPAAEFEPKAAILMDLRFCESSREAAKRAEAIWNANRPCVVANRRRSRGTKEESPKRTREERKASRATKRKMFRKYARSVEWKRYASSAPAVWSASALSAVCVGLLWLAILKWNLVYWLRYESVFPRKSDAYRFLYVATPIVWLALALVYRNVVVSRLKFRSLFKELKKKSFKKEVAEAGNDASKRSE